MKIEDGDSVKNYEHWRGTNIDLKPMSLEEMCEAARRTLEREKTREPNPYPYMLVNPERYKRAQEAYAEGKSWEEVMWFIMGGKSDED